MAEDAEYIIARCESLLRTLPRTGEPAILRRLRIELGANDDLRVRAAGPGGSGPWLVYLHPLVDPQRMGEEIEIPLATALRRGEPLERAWPAAKQATTAEEVGTSILHGDTAIVLGDEEGRCLLYDAGRRPGRQVDEPSTERVIVGPKEGFVEDLDTNLALVRRWLPDRSLRTEIVRVGRRSKSRVAVLYLEDVVRADLVPLIVQSLRRLRTDLVRTEWFIMETMVAGSLSPFPLAEPTERPDKVAQVVAEGRVAVLTDHSPFALLLPTTLWEFQKDSEDALPGPIVATFVRALRTMGSFLALTAPGLVVALLSANPGPLRPELANTLALTRAGLPYPVFPEMLLMMTTVDVFNEATAQAPGGVGNALSIVGTLIIGQISVKARLVSELVMVVAAATAMGSFLTLRYQFSYALRIWKYPILFLSGVTGLFGWLAGILMLITHLASLKSAGVPYLAPLAPLHPRLLLSEVVTQRSDPRTLRRSSVWEPRDPTRGNRHGSAEHDSGDPPA